MLSLRVRKEYEAELARVEATKVKQAQVAAAAEEEALKLINETQVRLNTDELVHSSVPQHNSNGRCSLIL